MGSASLAREKLARLLRILLALRTRSAPDARQLAEFCEVSRRTIFRDLSTLADAGLAVGFDPERAGYVLRGEARLDLLPMTREEIEGLALLALSGTDASALGRREAGHRALAHLADALPDHDREHLGRLIDRIDTKDRPSPGAVPHAIESKPIWDVLLKALVESRKVRIDARDPLGSVGSLATLLSPYRLHRQGQAWHVLGRSSLHREVRSFSVEEITQAKLTDELFVVPAQVPRPSRRAERQPTRVRAVHRPLAPSAGPPDCPGTLVSCIRLRDGRLDLEIDVPSHPESIDRLVRWALAGAGRVEIVEPALLRERVHALADRVARAHALRSIDSTTSETG
jgi:predicted DNA-binding transcriptional regulator YafY